MAIAKVKDINLVDTKKGASGMLNDIEENNDKDISFVDAQGLENVSKGDYVDYELDSNGNAINIKPNLKINNKNLGKGPVEIRKAVSMLQAMLAKDTNGIEVVIRKN